MAEAEFGGPACKALRALLERRLLVTLTSGRVLEGAFQCLDKQGNLILGHTVEQMPCGDGQSRERTLGMVLVPASTRQSVQARLSQEEADSYALVTSKLEQLKL
ncbi:hypothetical protein V8C86DRAFT_2790244 [Haematococcus lacustris]